MRAKKGSAFERKICVQLSLWWTEGKRTDVFWRSSQSGGRATQRRKKGLSTYGSYGDIAAIDPIGEPLIKMFTIELKRGSSYSCPGDLLDFKKENESHPWIKCLLQAIKAHLSAGSKAWMMICKRDHRIPIVFLESRIFKLLRNGPIATHRALVSFYLTVGINEPVHFVGLPLEVFLEKTSPKEIIKCLNGIDYASFH